MPKTINEAGEAYTSHWQTSPKTYIDKTCLSCHIDWTEEEAIYRIETIQNYIKGKLSKAEYWLGRLIDTFEIAIRAGVSEGVLNEAREFHSQAHILWEWWTAGNSGGFHNPDQARESLTRSVEYSKMGIEVLENALE
jgi:formate-dependent nitrite reductase cytochrome c552 subunit